MTWPYFECGPAEGPAVVLLHGMPGAKTDFTVLGERLAQNYRVICPDFPGFGANPAPRAGDPSLAGRARAVLSFADSLGLSSFALVAHSLGGATAIMLAAHYPERIRALVLLASVGLRRHRALMLPPLLLRALLPMVRGFSCSQKLAGRALSAVYERHGLMRPATVSSEQALWHLELFAALRFDALRSAAASVSCPTLVVYAEDDRLVAPAIAEELSSAIPGAERFVLAVGGHRLPQKRAAEIIDPVRSMLARGRNTESACN